MSKQKSSTLNLLVRILAILCTLSTPLLLLTFNIGRVLFNTSLIKEVLTAEVVDSDLLPAGLEWFSEWRAQQREKQGEALSGEVEPDIALLLSFLDYQEWNNIKVEIITSETLTGWVSTIVDGAYNWIDSDDPVPQITMDMRAFKQSLNSQEGENAITIAHSTLPDCTENEIQDFVSRQAAAPNTEVLYNLCLFPDPWYEDQFSDYLDALDDVVDETPDHFYLTEALGIAEDSGFESIKKQLRLARSLMQLSWLIPYSLLLAILALRIRSIKQLGHWWGWPLLIGGLATIILPLTYKGLLPVILSPLLRTAPEMLVQEAMRAILSVSKAIFTPMLIQSIIILALGLILIILGFVIAPREEQTTLSPEDM